MVRSHDIRCPSWSIGGELDDLSPTGWSLPGGVVVVLAAVGAVIVRGAPVRVDDMTSQR